MAGIIQDKMNPAQKQAPKFDHGAELQKMRSNMPPKMRNAFDRVVLAGQRIMYGKETKQVVEQFLSHDMPVANKLGEGVANLVVMIDNKANGAIPKDVLIPAGTVLLFDAADFLKQTGETISAQDIGKAYELMFYGIFEAYGGKPEQVDAVFDKMGQEHASKAGA